MRKILYTTVLDNALLAPRYARIIPTTWGVRERLRFLADNVGIIPTTWGVPALFAAYPRRRGIIPTTWGVQGDGRAAFQQSGIIPTTWGVLFPGEKEKFVSFHSKCKVWGQRPDTVRQFKEPCQCGVPRIFQGAA